MALDVLVQGRLTKAPESRTARNGTPFALAQVSTPMEEGDVLASVIAFRPEAVDALLALDRGDAVAVAGRAKVGVWQPREGDPRASLSITAEAVLSAYAIRRKRAAVQGDGHDKEGESGISADRDSPAPAAGRSEGRAGRLSTRQATGVGDLADDLPWPDADTPR
jgi:single-stranded DNA-binding protein